MSKWNYISPIPSSTGYEDVMDELKRYNKKLFLELSAEKQSELIDHIFTIYRGHNIYPITYYNDEGIISEIQKCVEKEVNFDGEILNLSFNQGSSLCRFLFPNLLKVDCRGVKNNSPIDKFYNDHKLKRAIKFCLDHKSTNTPVTPSGLKDGLDMITGNVATNFKPMNAKALYERYCPEGGIIYDFACGFGGRMLGALSSKKNFRYFGVEPNTETFDYLNELGSYIEKATNRTDIYKVYCKGSEDFRINKPYVDFAFSSPPYFSLEQYSDEPTQCYIKFPTLEEWFKGYVRPTIQNIYDMLKPDCYYAVNIADFKVGTTYVEYVDRWVELSKEVGFEYIENISMSLQSRRGVGNAEDNKKSKKEGIFIFKK
jgi:hypothetical protein